MNVFDFTDYRSFLNSYFDDQCQKDRNYSLQTWAKQLGLASRSTLAMILNGQRHAGPKVQKAFKDFFRFDEQRADYFANLVLLDKSSDDPSKKINIMERASSLHPSRKFQLLDHESFNAISSWHYHAIREMVRLKDFDERPEWIAQTLHFKITPSEAKKAISELVELGLLGRDENGNLIQTVGEVSSQDDVASEALKRFHEQCLSNAIRATREIPVKQRYLSSTTITISAKNFSAAKDLIRKFEQEFIELFEEDVGDLTIQLGMNIIPLTNFPSYEENHCEIH